VLVPVPVVGRTKRLRGHQTLCLGVDRPASTGKNDECANRLSAGVVGETMCVDLDVVSPYIKFSV
jgi:hypothetical protein